MPSVRTLRPFYDLVAHRDRKAGDVFDATGERAAQIAGKLPGYVEVIEERPQEVDYSALKVAELRAICSERGIEVPSKATKATIIELLEG